MKIATILGTRPEIIKMAPIIDEISKRSIPQIVLHTGQHYDKEMSDNIWKFLLLIITLMLVLALTVSKPA